MKYYVNNKIVNYTLFKYYLRKSILHLSNFTLTNAELNDLYYSYYNDMKFNNVELLFKDKLSYKIIKTKKLGNEGN